MDRTLHNLARRLDRLALAQLRAEVTDLAARLQAADRRIAQLEAELGRAVDDANTWHEQFMDLLQDDADARIGLMQDGTVLVCRAAGA
jgi:hypothetical protein